MKKIIPLLRLSAKQYFKQLRKQEIKNKNLNKTIIISRSFYSHITKKPRDIQDLAERLAMFPLIPKIISNGRIVFEDTDYIKISLKINNQYQLACIIYKEKNDNLALISCFQDFHKDKKSELS